mmetsp:Transcript_25283/g.58930  ORF Transcript_25283/g.58930 Transcript_25283/m.58930 type:complete len:324 (+) Transcript_25283:75-1046(+)
MGLVQLLVGAGGIYGAFLYYGSLQEDVLSFKSPSGHSFEYSWFLQVIEAGANVVLGFVCMLLFEDMRLLSVPQVPYVISGALQVTAKYCTTASMVAGVSFPVATLGKSSKMVPVMLGSLLLGNAKYSFREYLHVGLIVGGTVLVSVAKPSKSGKGSSGVGVLLLCGALACDGIVGGTQKRLKRTLAERGMKERNFEMQFLTNFWMMATAIVLAVSLGEVAPGYRFCMENPSIFWNVLAFAACSAVGQAFIFFTISSFDPLVCTTVTTTRKVFSVLYSILMKGHQMNTQGWLGVALASSGILGELEQKFSASRSKKPEDNKKEK